MNVERWQSLLEGMIEAVWLVDPLTLHIVAANRAATSMLNTVSYTHLDVYKRQGGARQIIRPIAGAGRRRNQATAGA